ncbi:MAG: hypothetical protein IT348_20090 [Candidatus Eisenbacteria bacterium]|nr:hypothetical protein [Candidatus Eisenbacteria bacterium]
MDCSSLHRELRPFEDRALLRRLPFNWKHMDRESDGSRHRLRDVSPADAATP